MTASKLRSILECARRAIAGASVMRVLLQWRGVLTAFSAGIEFVFNSRSMMGYRVRLWRAGRCLIVVPLLEYAAGQD